MSGPLKICIDARHAAGKNGGTSTFTLSLARALSRLTDGDEEYNFLVPPGGGAYLEQHLQMSLKVLEAVPIPTSYARRVAACIPFARTIKQHLRRQSATGVPKSDGTAERNKMEVIHFTAQNGFLAEIPFIYHPHDLQHRHLPQFFTPGECVRRERQYATLCKKASIVCAVSQWSRQDLLKSFHLPESQVKIVHFAPDSCICASTAPETVEAARQKLSLPDRFIFYPARTWPHKNHLQLLRALKILRDRHGLHIHLVCSGESTEFLATLLAEAKTLGLYRQVSFVGFVNSKELSAIYQLCSAVVIPTLFEAGSFPLWEAFLSERPAACSNVTSLPAQAGDAALIFDPYNVEDIAEAVRRLWTDQELCASLVQRGRANVSRYSWDRTARTFRALYRQLGKRRLTTMDEQLLSSAPFF